MHSRRRLPPGNDRAGNRENYSVNVAAELMDVIRDLCRFAGVLGIVGRSASAEALIEQSADLLVHRARLVARIRRDQAAKACQAQDEIRPLLVRGREWTN